MVFNDATKQGFFKGDCAVCGLPMFGTSKRGNPPDTHGGDCKRLAAALTQLETVSTSIARTATPEQAAAMLTTLRSRTMTCANHMGTGLPKKVSR